MQKAFERYGRSVEIMAQGAFDLYKLVGIPASARP